MTAAGGVNDDQFPQILDYFFAQPHIVSLMIQPLAFAGRGEQLAGTADAADHPRHRPAAGRGGLARRSAPTISCRCRAAIRCVSAWPSI